MKKACLILIASMAVVSAGAPLLRSVLPPEYLQDSGLTKALNKLIAVTLGLPVAIISILIFFNTLLGTGREKKPKDFQGFIDLRVKTGPRWLAAFTGVACAVLVVYVVTFVNFDSSWGEALSRGNAAVLLLLLACVGVLSWVIWGAIFSAVLRVRYDEERIFATNLVFRTREHNWNDLMKIKDMHISGGKRLIFRNTGNVYIDEYLEGFDDLMEYANEVLADA